MLFYRSLIIATSYLALITSSPWPVVVSDIHTLLRYRYCQVGRNGIIPADHSMQHHREKSEDAVNGETMRARRNIINHGFSGDESETRYRRSYEGG